MAAKKINQLVDVIRSKNAGPYIITFDLIFKDFTTYNKVKETKAINKNLIADLYNIKTEDIMSIINYDPAKAIKISIVRPYSSGAVGERDVYGAQQHAPLLDIEIVV